MIFTEYNVYIEDVNHNVFESYNIFEHSSFVEDLKDNIKKNGDNRKEFDEKLKSIIRYYFWSKCEWEIIVSSLIFTDRTKPKKVDAYDQIMLNWKIFENYIWENIDKIKKLKMP